MSKKINLAVGAVATVAATSLLVGCNLYGKDKYTVTYETNGGSAIAPSEYTWGDSLVLPTNPTRVGHTFKGWYFDAGLTNPVSDKYEIEGDIVLYAKWDVNQYTVSFDSNGGNDVADVKANYGTSINVTEPTRKGYEFDGWYLDEDFEESFNLKIPGQNTTVYAKWNECKVEIIFNMNATDATGEMAKATFETEDASLVLPKSNYARDGYNFKGWSTTIDGAVEFEDGASIVSLLDESQQVTLYAVWEARTYEIHFINDGLAHGDDIDVKYNSNIVLPTTNPTRAGYQFVGWGVYSLTTDSKFAANKMYYTYNSVSKAYVEANVTVDADVTANTYYEVELYDTTKLMPKNNLTLYSVYTTQSYTVTFDTVGGETISPITAAYGSTISIPQDVTKVGHTFVAWYTESTYENRFEGTTMPLNGATLYAKWEVNSYTVKFVSSEENDFQINAQTLNYNESKALTLNSHERVGYNFKGWATEVGGEVVYTDGASYTMGASDVTLYAVWEAKTDIKYVVNHLKSNLDGNTTTLAESEELTGTTDQLTEVVAKSYTGFKTPTITQVSIKGDGTTVVNVIYEREEYTVTFKDEEGNVIPNSEVTIKYEDTIKEFPANDKLGTHSLTWLISGETIEVNASTKITSNLELVANYELITSAITLMDGNNQHKVIKDVGAGTEISEILEVNKPSKDGYNFAGWYEDAACTIAYTGTTMPDENLILYAKFDIKVITISFNVNADDVDAVASIVKNYGEVVSAPQNPVKEGHTFLGWYADENDVLPYQFNTMPADDIELIAKWETNSYTVTFNTGAINIVVSPITAEYGSIISQLSGFESTLEGKQGHEFVRWTYYDGNELKGFDPTMTMPEDGLELIAEWKTLSYTFTFEVYDPTTNKTEEKTFTLDYQDKLEIPEFNKPASNYPYAYNFDGWYVMDGSGNKTKVEVPYIAFIDGETSITYYGEFVAEPFKVQFRNGNDGLIWETVYAGEEPLEVGVLQTVFFGYVKNLNAKAQAYTVINSAMETLIKGANAPSAMELASIVAYLQAYATQPGFSSLDAVTQYYGLQQSEKVPVKPTLEVCTALNGAFDLNNEQDYQYVMSILEVGDVLLKVMNNEATVADVMNALALPLDATSTNKQICLAEYEKYINNAYCPTRKGYLFNGWEVRIDNENGIKIVDATWVKKLDTPIYLRVQSIGKDKVRYAWNPVEGASSYTVEYTVYKDETKQTVVTSVTNITVDYAYYEVTGLGNGNFVELRVRANHPAGDVEDEEGNIIDHKCESNGFDLNDYTEEGSMTFEDAIVSKIEKIQMCSEFTSYVTHEHVGAYDAQINSEGEFYYRDDENGALYLFEATKYSFSNIKGLSINAGQEYISYVDGELIITHDAVGKEIDITIDFDGNPEHEKTYDVIVQPKINSISYGTNLTTYVDMSKVDEQGKHVKNNYKNKEVQAYTIGVATTTEIGEYFYRYEGNTATVDYYNGFKFDIAINGVSGDTYTVDEFSPAQFQLEYTFFDDKGNKVEDTSSLFVRDLETDTFYFLSSALDVNSPNYSEYYTVKVDYKRDGDGYKALGIPNKNKTDGHELTNSTVQFNIKLNNSVNVFTNEGMKEAYGDPNVSNISLHSNLKAQFTTTQVIHKDYLKVLVEPYKNEVDNQGRPSHGLDTWYSTIGGNIDVKPGTAVFSNEAGLAMKLYRRGSGRGAITDVNGQTYIYVGEGGTHALVEAEWVNNWVDGQFAVFNNDASDAQINNFLRYGIETGSIFQRTLNAVEDGINVEGNYFTIDASDLPYVMSDKNEAATQAYKVQSGRVSVFETTDGDSTFNNLTIIGNTLNASANLGGATGGLSPEKYMEQTSGGIFGVRSYAKGSWFAGMELDMTTNNVIIENTLIGVYGGYDANLYVIDSIVNNSWSNGLFSWGAREVEVSNSELVNSGGSSFHVVDTEAYINDQLVIQHHGYEADGSIYQNGCVCECHCPEYGVLADNPQFALDFNSQIENFVSGEEPWFKQHGMEVAALNLKSGLQQIAEGASAELSKQFSAMLGANLNIPLSVITTRTENGLTSEVMNLLSIGMVDKRASKYGSDIDKGFELVYGSNTTVLANSYIKEGSKDNFVLYAHNFDMKSIKDLNTAMIALSQAKFYIEFTTYMLGSDPVKVIVEAYVNL